MKAKLKPWEQLFCNEYVQNGQNQRQALLKAKPNLTPGSASTIANRLLNRVDVQDYIQELTNTQIDKLQDQENRWTRDATLNRLDQVIGQAEDKEQYQAAIRGVETGAKIAGLFQPEDKAKDKYLTFVQQFFQLNQGDRGKATLSDSSIDLDS